MKTHKPLSIPALLFGVFFLLQTSSQLESVFLLDAEKVEQEERVELDETEEYEKVVRLFKSLDDDKPPIGFLDQNLIIKQGSCCSSVNQSCCPNFQYVTYYILYCRLKIAC
jgi:hypothetical protein